MIRKFIFVAIATATALSSRSATAQDYTPPPLSGIGFTNAMIFGEEQARRSGESSQSNAISRRSIRPDVLRANLSYTPSTERRRANVSAFVEKSRKIDPAAAAKMQTLFASTDVIATMQAPMAKIGLRIDNVADAFAIWSMQAWGAAHGDDSDSSRAQAQAVKLQITRALAASSEFAAASDATKQAFAETLLLQTIVIAAGQEEYKNDPVMMRKMGVAVRKGAKASGLDLDAMTLTENGFVPSGKTGVADPAPGAPETALAANAAPVPAAPADKSPPYLLIAAAGGAGVGGVFLLGKAMGKRG